MDLVFLIPKCINIFFNKFKIKTKQQWKNKKFEGKRY